MPDYIGQHQKKKKPFTVSTGHDLFKNRKNSKMLKWVESIKGRDHSSIEGEEKALVTHAMQNPPRIVERRRKKMVTNAHFMADKHIKGEPYLVNNGNVKADVGEEVSGQRSKSISSNSMKTKS